MPFADKFRAMLGLPFAGDTLGEPPGMMIVESIYVGHEGRAPGLYAYPLRLVLRGSGGQAAVKRAIKALFARRCTTFSGFGTPYQLWMGKPAIESLGQGRYAVTAEGDGARVHLGDDLARFGAHLQAAGLLGVDVDGEAVVAAYLEGYKAEVARLVGAYKGKVRRREGEEGR